jgi:hypothetical protein
MTTNKPECKTVGDCGELGISGLNMACGKKGYCENCSSDLDCNGVNAPIGKCIDNICSCLDNSTCSCEGNDPYGCGYDDKGKCICSDKNKGLAAIKKTGDQTEPEKQSQKSLFIILSSCLFLILIWVIFIVRFSKIKNIITLMRYLMYGVMVICLITIGFIYMI